MSGILIKFNDELNFEENNKVLEKAVKMLKESGIECEGFTSVVDMYYFTEVETSYACIKDEFKDNAEFTAYCLQKENNEMFSEISERISNTFDSTVDFECICDYTREYLFRGYLNEIVTLESLNELNLVFDGENKKIQDIDSKSQELIKDAFINEMLASKGELPNIVVVETDDFGLNVKFK